jgi:hypothetical protein
MSHVKQSVFPFKKTLTDTCQIFKQPLVIIIGTTLIDSPIKYDTVIY